MPLFKKESKEEIRKKAIIKVLKDHAHLLEELFTEELIEKIPENGLVDYECFNEEKYNYVLIRYFFLNMVISRLIAVDLKEFVTVSYEDERLMAVTNGYLALLGCGTFDEIKERSMKYGL